MGTNRGAKQKAIEHISPNGLLRNLLLPDTVPHIGKNLMRQVSTPYNRTRTGYKSKKRNHLSWGNLFDITLFFSQPIHHSIIVAEINSLPGSCIDTWNDHNAEITTCPFVG